MTTLEPIVQPQTDQEIVRLVNEYAYAATGHNGSLTTQSRRVIAALKAVGLKRSEFSARTDIQRGVYGEAIGTPRDSRGSAVIIRNARVLAKCGLRVHVINEGAGRENAFVHTSRTPGITVHATVGSPIDPGEPT